MELGDLEIFVHVADRGSFSAAAEHLGMPKSTVGRRIQRLEAVLGVELVRRSGRRWTLTQDGEQLAERGRGPIHELAALRETLHDSASDPAGLVRMTVPVELGGSPRLARILRAYREAFPRVRIELQTDDRFVDLIGDGFDLALRAYIEGPPPRDDLIARRLLPIDAVLLASRDYLARRGEPGAPSELQGHELVAPSPSSAFGSSWPFSSMSSGEPTAEAGFQASEFRALHSAIVAGMGIGALPLFLAADDLAEGTLVQVLPASHFEMGAIWAVWPRTRHLSPRVRTLVDFLAGRLGDGAATVVPV